VRKSLPDNVMKSFAVLAAFWRPGGIPDDDCAEDRDCQSSEQCHKERLGGDYDDQAGDRPRQDELTDFGKIVSDIFVTDEQPDYGSKDEYDDRKDNEKNECENSPILCNEVPHSFDF